MEFFHQPWNFTKFAPKFYQIRNFVVTTKKLSSNLESPHFPTFSAKCCKCKIRKKDGYGKSRNGHGKVMEKYFVKSVETLPFILGNPYLHTSPSKSLFTLPCHLRQPMHIFVLVPMHQFLLYSCSRQPVSACRYPCTTVSAW